jgi:hypothetical protein
VKHKSSRGHAADTQITPHVSQHENRSQSAEEAQASGLPEVRYPGPMQAWLRFWFTPVDPVGLHVLRVLGGSLFAFWLLAFVGHQTDFFGLTGFLDIQGYKEASRLPGGPPLPFGWSVLYLCGADPTLVNIMYWGAIAVFLLFAAGVATRITSILTWVLVVSFTANPTIFYDADFLLVVLALYFMLAYSLFGLWSRNLSALEKVLGPTEGGLEALFARRDREETAPRLSYAANLALRLLQVHFAIIIVTSALHKLQYGDWWTGVAFWYPMHPPLETSFAAVTSPASAPSVLFVLSVLAYVTLAWQLSFPLFAWRRGWWRLVLVGGALIGWAGNVFIFHLPLFGPIYVLAALSYLTPEEWHRSFAWLRSAVTSFSGNLQTPEHTRRKSARVGT